MKSSCFKAKYHYNLSPRKIKKLKLKTRGTACLNRQL